MENVSGIAAALDKVRRGVEDAAKRVGRRAEDVTVVAVSKLAEVTKILEAFEAGQVDFGENRAHELVQKSQEVPKEIRWHFIGYLQRNKVRSIAGIVHMVHSLDRLELANELKEKNLLKALVEVNVSGEAAKSGIPPEHLMDLLQALSQMQALNVEGLMTMAPFTDDPERSRPYFAQLTELRSKAAARFPEMGIRHLSMGMSQDYRVAIEEGATIVRIGEAIFGPRPGRKPQWSPRIDRE